MTPQGIVVDLFAGGGGASVGIEAALGRDIDLAINHDPIALAVHKVNHPRTEHLTADVWEVRPQDAVRGRPVDVLWSSPDCRHFSVAKGGKPRKQNIRSLAWVVTRWAKAVRPRLIFLENVSEFRGWGPLGPDGQPDKARMGETFRRWLARLEKLGYVIEYRVLDASAYGAPTRRRRLFLVARRDGLPIVWPKPTHGKGALPLHTAAECIDWSLPCPSIFERKKPLAEKTLWRIAQGIKRFVLESTKPFIVAMNHSNAPHGTEEPLGVVTTQHNRFNLVEAVIAEAPEEVPTFEEWFERTKNLGGTREEYERIYGDGGGNYIDGDDSEDGEEEAFQRDLRVLRAFHDAAEEEPEEVIGPSLMKFRFDSEGARIDEPAPTITAGNGRADRPAGAGHALGVLAPHLVKVNHGGQDARGEDLDAPLSTVTATQRGHALVAPHLIKVNHGNDEKTGQREHSLGEPLTTVTASGNGHALIAPTLIQTGYGERKGQRPRFLDLQEPLGACVAGGQKHALVAAHLSRQFGQGVGSDLVEPAPTVMPAGQGKTALVSAFLSAHYGGMVGDQLELPVRTITATDHNALSAATLVKLRGECAGADLEEPMPTVTAGGTHVAEVRAFLTAYYGEDATAGQSLFDPLRTITTKHRLGLVTVEGTEYQIVDIGMRMLEPHELLAAQFGRFAAGYDLSAARTKSGKVRLIGNSVCPEMAEVLVRANVESLEEEMVA